jgi:hypothetical protein
MEIIAHLACINLHILEGPEVPRLTDSRAAVVYTRRSSSAIQTERDRQRRRKYSVPFFGTLSTRFHLGTHTQ